MMRQRLSNGSKSAEQVRGGVASSRARSRRPVVALAADALTRACLEPECEILDVRPSSFVLPRFRRRPDLLLVESAWEGRRNRWKYKIASYPDHPRRSNAALAKLVARARDAGVPTVFWNREDEVHFDRFIESAKLFDHVLTVDENCVSRYRDVVGPDVTVGTMMFAAQPALHAPTAARPTIARANFVGSYSRHVHDGRRALQHMLFESASRHLGLTVWDRNSRRRSSNYRYPEHIALEVRPAIQHHETARVYREHLVSLNVNTVVDSPTMFSRRLVEILASGGLAVTTPSRAVDRLFADFCHVVGCAEEADELFSRLARDGLSARDLEMKAAGAAHVARHFTWEQRLQQVLEVAGLA